VARSTSQAPPGEDGAARPSPVRAVAGNLFLGLPPLLMLALGVVVGLAGGIGIGVVVWTVAR